MFDGGVKVIQRVTAAYGACHQLLTIEYGQEFSTEVICSANKCCVSWKRSSQDDVNTHKDDRQECPRGSGMIYTRQRLIPGLECSHCIQIQVVIDVETLSTPFNFSHAAVFGHFS